jgi:hypothetical protein
LKGFRIALMGSILGYRAVHDLSYTASYDVVGLTRRRTEHDNAKVL